MKTAISIPDALFRQVELHSRRLRISRSRLFADAAREYIDRQPPMRDATEAWNEVIAECGQPGDDPDAAALQRRGRASLRAAAGKRR